MIKVYTTTQCAYCEMVKKYLTIKGKEFEVVKLDDDPALRQSLFEKTGVRSVPITQSGDRFVVGYNPTTLASL